MILLKLKNSSTSRKKQFPSILEKVLQRIFLPWTSPARAPRLFSMRSSEKRQALTSKALISIFQKTGEGPYHQAAPFPCRNRSPKSRFAADSPAKRSFGSG